MSPQGSGPPVIRFSGGRQDLAMAAARAVAVAAGMAPDIATISHHARSMWNDWSRRDPGVALANPAAPQPHVAASVPTAAPASQQPHLQPVYISWSFDGHVWRPLMWNGQQWIYV